MRQRESEEKGSSDLGNSSCQNYQALVMVWM